MVIHRHYVSGLRRLQSNSDTLHPLFFLRRAILRLLLSISKHLRVGGGGTNR